MTTINPIRSARRSASETLADTHRASASTGHGPTPGGAATVPASMVERVSLVLRAFSNTGPMTLAQVTAATGLPRSSVHRLLDQLVNSGWLARSTEHSYELGVNAYEMGQSAFRQNRLLQKAVPAMNAFVHRTGYTIQLGVVDRGDTVYFAKTNGRKSGPTPTSVGQRVPAHLTAVGKMIMANAAGPPDTRWPAPQGPPVHRLTPYQQELENARNRGSAFDHGGAFPGIACVGVSIGPADHPYGNLAGLSVTAPIGSFDPRQLVAPLRIVAGEIWDRCVATDLSRH